LSLQKYDTVKGQQIHSGICVPKLVNIERGLTELLTK